MWWNYFNNYNSLLNYIANNNDKNRRYKMYQIFKNKIRNESEDQVMDKEMYKDNRKQYSYLSLKSHSN